MVIANRFKEKKVYKLALILYDWVKLVEIKHLKVNKNTKKVSFLSKVWPLSTAKDLICKKDLDMSRAKLIEHDHYENSAYPHQFNSETEYDEWFQKKVKSALQLAENEDNFISEEEAEAHVKEFFKSLR